MLLRLKRRTRAQSLTPGGRAVVEGRVFASRSLKAPGSGTECVFFQSVTESFEVGARGRGRKMWVPKRSEQRSAGFYLEDETGRVWIADDAEASELIGGREEGGQLGKKGRQRYFNRIVVGGDTVRVQGLVADPKGAEPGDNLVIRPDAKSGRITILVK